MAAQQIRADLGNGVGRGGMERAFLIDDAPHFLQLFRLDAAEHFRRRAYMDDGLWRMPAQSLQHAGGALDVGVQRVQRGIKAGLGIALRRQMEHIIRRSTAHRVVDGNGVAKIAVHQAHALLAVDAVDEVFDIVQWAAPSAQTADLPVRFPDQKVRQMRPHHPGDACD